MNNSEHLLEERYFLLRMLMCIDKYNSKYPSKEKEEEMDKLELRIKEIDILIDKLRKDFKTESWADTMG